MKRLTHLITGIVLGSLLTTIAFAISSRMTTVQDAVKTSPQYYKVLLENDQVRVLEYRLRPGEKEPMHSHPARVVYIFSDNKVKIAFPDGRVTEGTRKAGDIYWHDPVTHAAENIGSTENHALAVELKNPCK